MKSIRDSLPPDNRPIIDSIFKSTSELFTYYKNRNGGITYNFYPVRPEENPFPNAKFSPRSKRRRLADDLDDTSMLYLVQNSSDSLNHAIKAKMVDHSTKKLYTSTFKQYRKNKVYKTWFTEKINQDIDICVLSNVLVFIFEKNLPLTSIDTASLGFIKSSIRHNLHLNKEHLISAHYQNSSIVLYHVARLISAATTPLLDEIRGKVISDIHQQLNLANNSMEEVILLASLFRLGGQKDYEINFTRLEEDMRRFYWFKANPFCGSRFWIKQLIGRSNFLHEQYKCEAYYWSLVLELSSLSDANFTLSNKQPTAMYKRH
ncbi:MAG: hypothetical protein SH819_15075 [Cytophagales bacterium]|nr:hypothetical protein [Cytophagales bacterium]